MGEKSLLYSCTLFFVLHCHLMEIGDSEDLAIVNVFVNSLQKDVHTPKTAAKLHGLSKVFHSASLYYITKPDGPVDNFSACRGHSRYPIKTAYVLIWRAPQTCSYS